MKIIDRIQTLIEYKGLSYNKFDELIEVGNGYIGKQIKRSGSVGGDIIEKIVSIFPDVNPVWLIKGEGEMIIDPKSYPLSAMEGDIERMMVSEPETPYNSGRGDPCRDKERIIEQQRETIEILKQSLEIMKDRIDDLESARKKAG